MTIMYLGWANTWMLPIFDQWDWKQHPIDILLAFNYTRDLASQKARNPRVGEIHAQVRRWFLDSGAYSAFNSGEVIDHNALMAEQKAGRWDDIASLDVIGDWKASRANWYTEQAAGVRSAPTFHIGDPWELLAEYKTVAPKINLGGIAPLRDDKRLPWLRQCFARGWPHKFHAFGVMSDAILKELPFHSCDSTGWYQGVVMGGASILPNGKAQIGPKTNTHSRIRQVRSRAEKYASLGRFLEQKWSRSLRSIPKHKEDP
jgi:hypothetical protein